MDLLSHSKSAVMAFDPEEKSSIARDWSVNRPYRLAAGFMSRFRETRLDVRIIFDAIALILSVGSAHRSRCC